MTSLLTPRHRRAWEEDGWCILERAVPADSLEAAQRAVAKLFPTAKEMAAELGRGATPPPGGNAPTPPPGGSAPTPPPGGSAPTPPPGGSAPTPPPGGSAPTPPPGGSGETVRWRTWDAAWPEFPFRSRTLSALVVSDLLVDLAQALLSTTDVRLYLALATAKYAGQPSEYNQLLHVDYPNHTLTVPRTGTGYQQVETFVYLTDVGPENGATRFVSRRRTAGVPVEEHTLNLTDYAELYEDRTDASAPAGSVVVYRPDVYHRSVDFTDPGRVRFMLHAAYRPASLEWGGYQAWPIKGYSAEWHAFVAGATPRQLGVLGFPPPGHAFWTEATIDGVGRRYPGLDLTPWRQAMAGGDPAPAISAGPAGPA